MSDLDAGRSFPALLRDQIRHGFTAGQQYLAAAVYFEANRLPQLARHCYGRSDEHRGHALRMVQHLLDRDLEVTVGGLDEVRPTFESPHAAIAFLHAREQRLTDQTVECAKAARASNDYLGEQFMQWFLEQQLDEVSAMTTLLTVLERAAGNLFDVEEFAARELPTTVAPAGNSAPKMAGTVRN
ncbi:ferritin [Nocardia cyriacigeorgica]|uniref:ferritin n=1 Tax=Nocardia cyriacigeorgica TaxID=135487 RepID=UPI0013D4D6E5|nr:ferritin-like domain-containing protein [Nocardia cyriacigeorgica]MBF6437908.1 ferritin [Nocardia cyriacigeorgica]MBF6453457.1 ferritin [Nocardia cyriacigeorgica]MBF6481678.1 ferritin [Nocardia cyriacigeorgica]MBF6550626.1 ferritin [Nocardia cyriacigeorgica]NEW29894.1 ferritin [Nocardia cyriacigeorgica]